MSRCPSATQQSLGLQRKAKEMNCYVCALIKRECTAIGLCNQCSAGLCIHHAIDVTQSITRGDPIVHVVELPLKARRLVCQVCKDAYEQPHKLALQEDMKLKTGSQLETVF